MGRRKGPDEVFCRACGEPIKRAAELCPNCGVRNHEATSAPPSGTGSGSGSETDATTPRATSADETSVSESWYVAVVAGIGLSVLGIAFSSGEPTSVLGSLGGFAFLAGWFLLPLGVYQDAKYVSANSGWDPEAVVWVVLALLWFVNVVAGAVYLYRRHEVLGVP